jgi:hypothetical protein
MNNDNKIIIIKTISNNDKIYKNNHAIKIIIIKIIML